MTSHLIGRCSFISAESLTQIWDYDGAPAPHRYLVFVFFCSIIIIECALELAIWSNWEKMCVLEQIRKYVIGS